MAENGKPINPMERQEKVGIIDGIAPSQEPLAEGRHGFGEEVRPIDLDDKTPRTPGQAALDRKK